MNPALCQRKSVGRVAAWRAATGLAWEQAFGRGLRLALSMASLSLALATTTARAQTEAPAAAPSDSLANLSSTELAARMGVGWNLGNSLEAIGGETAWGNPVVTRQLIEAVRAAGFRTLRIPVAWKQYADAQDNISPAWLARVQQVVDMARAAGLYTLINIHWDGGWMQPTDAHQAAANARITRYWTQIAQHFQAYDEGLLFACTNEVMKEGDWGPPTPEYRRVQNSFNQTCVDAVRATGGRNARRHLVVQGFNTDINHTVNFAVLPRDSAQQRLMMEVHYYDPYRYTLDDKSGIWQWGAGATDRSATDSWGQEDWADAQFLKMKKAFGDLGVPVILGEFGVIARTDIAGAEAFRIAWNRHIARSARRHGLVPVYWDNGVTGQHGMGLFDRASGQAVHPQLIRALVEAAP